MRRAAAIAAILATTALGGAAAASPAEVAYGFGSDLTAVSDGRCGGPCIVHNGAHRGLAIDVVAERWRA